MPVKNKITPKVPPHHQYCPVCGDKASLDGGELKYSYECSEITIKKYCNKCGANWKVKYYLKPKAITDIKVYCEYEDIPL